MIQFICLSRVTETLSENVGIQQNQLQKQPPSAITALNNRAMPAMKSCVLCFANVVTCHVRTKVTCYVPIYAWCYCPMYTSYEKEFSEWDNKLTIQPIRG